MRGRSEVLGEGLIDNCALRASDGGRKERNRGERRDGRRERPLQLLPGAVRQGLDLLIGCSPCFDDSTFAFAHRSLHNTLTRRLPKPTASCSLQNSPSWPWTERFFAPALLTSRPQTTTTTSSSKETIIIHNSRDQCGVTCKRRAGSCGGRALANHYHTALAHKKLPPAGCRFPAPHTCCASCSHFGDRPAYYRCAC